MIGGTDIVISVRDETTAMQLALRTCLRLWVRPVFEDAATGEIFSEYGKLVLGGRPELLVYRDMAARALWDELGADPSLDGTMIHLITRRNELTLAVDDIPDVSIKAYIAAVRRCLRQDIFASYGERRAA